MTLPVAAWRVTYTPGNWLALSGPTTLVVMLPAPARVSDLVSQLWQDLIAADSADSLLALMAELGLDAMPDFGAFFWDAEGLHGLARGKVRIVDTDTGQVALEGRGSVTWREQDLGSDRRLRIDLEPVDQDDMLQLPLVVGVVSVSAVYLTTAEHELLRFPSRERLGVLPEIPQLGRPVPRSQGSTPAQHAASPALEASAESAPPAPPAAHAVPASPPPVAAPVPPAPIPAPMSGSSASTVPPAPAPSAAPAPAASAPHPSPVEEFPQPTMDPAAAIGAGEPTFGQGPLEETPVPPPPGPPSVGSPVPMGSPPRQAPSVVPPRLGEIDDDTGGTIFSTGLAATHKPAPPKDIRQDPLVLAVPCQNGHANAPGSRQCRLCQGPVDPSNPRLVRRPVLAAVRTNQGEFADVVSGVVVGRSPDQGNGPAGSSLMRVPSPSNDISRNHVLITTRDWTVHVTDLHSTNGTTVLPTSEAPFTIRDGASIQVELGTVLDLGDGVSLRIEPPRS